MRANLIKGDILNLRVKSISLLNLIKGLLDSPSSLSVYLGPFNLVLRADIALTRSGVGFGFLHKLALRSQKNRRRLFSLVLSVEFNRARIHSIVLFNFDAGIPFIFKNMFCLAIYVRITQVIILTMVALN